MTYRLGIPAGFNSQALFHLALTLFSWLPAPLAYAHTAGVPRLWEHILIKQTPVKRIKPAPGALQSQSVF